MDRPHQRTREEVRLSPEEQVVYKKCMRYSLITHSLPTSALTMFLLNKYRPGIKLSRRIMAGTFVGIFAQIPAVASCLGKVVAEVPNGEIAKFRERTRAGREPQVFSDEKPYADAEQIIPSYDDTLARPSPSREPIIRSQQTYDDLRRKNREEFISRRTGSPQRQAPPNPVAEPLPPDSDHFGSNFSDPVPSQSTSYDPPSPYSEAHVFSPEVAEDQPRRRKPKKLNKYGDEIED